MDRRVYIERMTREFYYFCYCLECVCVPCAMCCSVLIRKKIKETPRTGSRHTVHSAHETKATVAQSRLSRCRRGRAAAIPTALHQRSTHVLRLNQFFALLFSLHLPHYFMFPSLLRSSQSPFAVIVFEFISVFFLLHFSNLFISFLLLYEIVLVERRCRCRRDSVVCVRRVRRTHTQHTVETIKLMNSCMCRDFKI